MTQSTTVSKMQDEKEPILQGVDILSELFDRDLGCIVKQICSGLTIEDIAKLATAYSKWSKWEAEFLQIATREWKKFLHSIGVSENSPALEAYCRRRKALYRNSDIAEEVIRLQATVDFSKIAKHREEQCDSGEFFTLTPPALSKKVLFTDQLIVSILRERTYAFYDRWTFEPVNYVSFSGLKTACIVKMTYLPGGEIIVICNPGGHARSSTSTHPTSTMQLFDPKKSKCTRLLRLAPGEHFGKFRSDGYFLFDKNINKDLVTVYKVDRTTGQIETVADKVDLMFEVSCGNFIVKSGLDCFVVVSLPKDSDSRREVQFRAKHDFSLLNKLSFPHDFERFSRGIKRTVLDRDFYLKIVLPRNHFPKCTLVRLELRSMRTVQVIHNFWAVVRNLPADCIPSQELHDIFFHYHWRVCALHIANALIVWDLPTDFFETCRKRLTEVSDKAPISQEGRVIDMSGPVWIGSLVNMSDTFGPSKVYSIISVDEYGIMCYRVKYYQESHTDKLFINYLS